MTGFSPISNKINYNIVDMLGIMSTKHSNNLRHTRPKTCGWSVFKKYGVETEVVPKTCGVNLAA